MKSKTALEINKYNELWIIDSGASHHITNKLSDYTSYTPYAIPEEVQTANKHDSLTILGEGTVFFDTETTNGQILSLLYTKWIKQITVQRSIM